jgi:hypothetical protein
MPTSGVAPRGAPAYWRSWWIRTGVGLLIVGAGPLVFIIVAAAVGLWPDPNPNPIGPGLLFFFTFWPAILCIVVGVIRVRRAQRAHS